MDHKSYYAIIPACVRYDNSLNANAKLLYGEITALCNERGFCWANNSYFAKLYGVSDVSISTWIKKLKESGHIVVEYEKRGFEVVQRNIFLSLGLSKLKPSVKENFNRSVKENFKYNTTVNNTTKHISIKDTNTHECGDVDLFGESKPPKVKKEPDPIIDGVLQWFKKTYGFIPTDRKPRFVAFNLIRSVTSMYKRVKGTNVVDKAELGQVMVSFLKWYSKQKGYDNTQRLETVRSKLPVFEAEAKGLRK